MKTKLIVCAIVGVFLMTPLAFGQGLLPLNPLVNGDFDTYVTPGMAAALEPVANRCIGVGHQVLEPYESDWLTYVLGVVNDPTNQAPQIVGDPASAASTLTGYPISYAGTYATNPNKLHECDPNWNELAMVNAWEISRSRGLGWVNDSTTQIRDYNGNGDQEAVFGTTSGAFLYQSFASTQQAWSADFDTFEFTLEAGQIPPPANIQIGFSLTPGYQQSPWVGVFWEGGIQFNSAQMVPDGQGRIHLDPMADGSIICPAGYTPCLDFQTAYNAPNADKHTLLGQVRLVQTSFWSFGNPTGHVVIDDVAYVGAKTMAETPPNPNPAT